MKKVQLSIYLDQEIFASLEAYATRQGKPKSLVAEAAIGSFLSPDDSDRREAAIAKRLDRIVRVLERLERNDGITLETVALFIRFWLTSTPALPLSHHQCIYFAGVGIRFRARCDRDRVARVDLFPCVCRCPDSDWRASRSLRAAASPER